MNARMGHFPEKPALAPSPAATKREKNAQHSVTWPSLLPHPEQKIQALDLYRAKSFNPPDTTLSPVVCHMSREKNGKR